jgi:branched-chain amino acid transport system ATP-binding protein
MGLTHARDGAVRIFGHVTTDWQPYRIAALGVGYVPEGRRIFPNLSVEENLKVPLDRKGPWTIARIYELFPRLAQRKSNKGRQLSGGEQEMLAIARALLLNPKLLLLDEPSQGLAPLIVQEVFRVVAAARQQGISVLLVEQNVRAAVEIADRAYVLDDGRVVYSGIAAEFAKDEERARARRRQRRKLGAGGGCGGLGALLHRLQLGDQSLDHAEPDLPKRGIACIQTERRQQFGMMFCSAGR